MLSSLRRNMATVLALALIASAFALTPSTATAEEITYEAEGSIIGMNPLVPITRNSFLLACAVPPTQGVDGLVFELPEDFGAGDATVAVTGGDLTGAYDLDVFFYTADCSGAGGSLATVAQDETGPIPAETAWVVVDAFLGVDTAVSLKATRELEGGKVPVIKASLKTSATRIKHGNNLKLSGFVTGCTAKEIEIYADRSDRGLFSVGKVEVSEQGAYEMNVSPTVNTTYFADLSDHEDCRAIRSVSRPVKVEPRINITESRKCRWVTGRVSPNQQGTDVSLQRRTNERWTNVGATRLSESSWFRLDLPSCGSYRVAWSDADSHLTGTVREV